MSRLKPGQTLEFITDDVSAADSIPEWCELREYTLQNVSSLPDGRLRFVLRK